MSGRIAVLCLLTLLGIAFAPVAHADAIRDRQRWVLSALDVGGAWKTTRGTGVTVAVLDSGVDARQRDLAGSVRTGPDYTRGASPRGTPPARLHGTNMASLIAGHGHGPGRRDGVIGVAPDARILSVRVLLERGEAGRRRYINDDRFRDAVAKGVRYAVDHGAEVINLSLGGDDPISADREAISYAISRGVVVVAAAGNDGDSKKVDKDGFAPYTFPAAFPGVIGVAAVRRGSGHTAFSSRNSSVVVAAPGAGIVGAGPGDAYWVGAGTSQATALVSGVVALIRARYPELSPALVAHALTASTRHRPTKGYNVSVGFGVVNAAAALAEAGKLAQVRRASTGLPGTRRFGGEAAEPVQVVRRDRGLIALGVWLGTGALVGVLGTVIAMVLLCRGRPPVRGVGDAGGGELPREAIPRG